MKTILRAASILALSSAPAFAATNFYSFADTDRDGFITSDELAAVSPAFTSTIYTQLDLDQSGDIVVEEISDSPLLRGFTFSSPAQFRRDAPTIVRRYGSYRVIDRNGDGMLSAGEVSAVIPTVTRSSYMQADLNADGFIDFNELYGWRYYTRLEDTARSCCPRKPPTRIPSFSTACATPAST